MSLWFVLFIKGSQFTCKDSGLSKEISLSPLWLPVRTLARSLLPRDEPDIRVVDDRSRWLWRLRASCGRFVVEPDVELVRVDLLICVLREYQAAAMIQRKGGHVLTHHVDGFFLKPMSIVASSVPFSI